MNTLDRFESYQDKIQTIKSSFGSPLSGIMKYVLSDADKVINVSLFSEKIKQISQTEIDNVLAFLSLSSVRNKALIDEVKSDSLLNDSQKKFILNAALHIQEGLDMLNDAVYIEAEKGGFVLEEVKKKDLLSSIESHETLLYGPRISDVASEKEAVLTHLNRLFVAKKVVLSANEESQFVGFLKKFGNNLGDVAIQNPIDELSDQKKYDADVVAAIFTKIYSIYGEKPIVIYEKEGIESPIVQDGKYLIPVGLHVSDKKKFYEENDMLSSTKIVVSDKAANFSVGVNKDFGDHTLTFPSQSEYSFHRLCQLIDHEIGTHFVRNKNASVGVDVKSAGYLETEEGIATANEQLATRDRSDLSAGEPTIHHISTFIGENYDADETKKLLTIYYKLIGKSEAQAIKEATSRTERVKRYHANDLPGANRKDTVYWRGMRTVIDYLKNVDVNTLQHDADLIYRGKFSEGDMTNIDGLAEGLHLDSSKRISPLALGKILYEKYKGNEVTKQALQEKDMRFQLSVKDLTFGQKRELLEILKLLD